MKKVEVTLKQVGKDIVVKGEIKVRVAGKFTSAKLYDIVTEAIELPEGIAIYGVNTYDEHVKIGLKSKYDVIKTVDVKLESGTITYNGKIREYADPDNLTKSLQKLESAILEIEAWAKEQVSIEKETKIVIGG